VNHRFSGRVLNRNKKTGQVQLKKKTRRKRTVRTKEMVKKVTECFIQKGNQLMRKMAIDMSRTLLGKIKNDLILNPYKKQKVYGLTEVQKATRVQKCRQLLAWYAGDDIIFSDEKQVELQLDYEFCWIRPSQSKPIHHTSHQH
jgi:hypothetical protein